MYEEELFSLNNVEDAEAERLYAAYEGQLSTVEDAEAERLYAAYEGRVSTVEDAEAERLYAAYEGQVSTVKVDCAMSLDPYEPNQQLEPADWPDMMVVQVPHEELQEDTNDKMSSDAWWHQVLPLAPPAHVPPPPCSSPALPAPPATASSFSFPLEWLYLYLYHLTNIPEFGRPVWVVLFSQQVFDLCGFTVALWRVNESGACTHCVHQQAIDNVDSWTAVRPNSTPAMIQYKLCVRLPEDRGTFNNECFAFVLTHRDGLRVVLGGLRVVSNSKQRDTVAPMLNRLFPRHQQALLNFMRHPPRVRHFRNGKGSSTGQRALKPPTFFEDQFWFSVLVDDFRF